MAYTLTIWYTSESSFPIDNGFEPNMFDMWDGARKAQITAKWRGSTVKSEIEKKTMRSLKREDSPIISGYQIFHNYVREHESLDGKTPAELAGVKIEGNNKWLTLIQNAAADDPKVSGRNHDPKT